MALFTTITITSLSHKSQQYCSVDASAERLPPLRISEKGADILRAILLIKWDMIPLCSSSALRFNVVFIKESSLLAIVYKHSVVVRSHFTLWSSPSLVLLRRTTCSDIVRPVNLMDDECLDWCHYNVRRSNCDPFGYNPKFDTDWRYNCHGSALPTEIMVRRYFTPIGTSIDTDCHSPMRLPILLCRPLPSISIVASANCSHKTTPAAIALSVIGTLASVVVLQIIFILVLWRRGEYHDRVSKSVSGDIEPGTAPEPNSNLALISEPTTASADSVEPLIFGSTPLSPIPEGPSESSHHAYEEEIERLREEVLAQRNLNRILHEQLELGHGGSPPPSYRSRRSDNSHYRRSSSSLPRLPSLSSSLRQSRHHVR
ncbi:hypothetical protein F5146DRAFT_1143942 [Armillaria mellea]|nr:hypothetical protein F5146DRAFT_1143942 [Armillaria mellea]